MQGSQISKRVSWASDASICQVRLFLSEEPPSQVGLGAQDHLQAKKTLSGPVNGLVADDYLPPGFEGYPTNQLKNKLAQIPLVKWRCPARFIVDVAWQVISGEESKEVEIQNQRELRVLEAIYPRQSAIPPNPAVSPDVESTVHEHQTLPLIPITPIEEEDPSVDVSSDSTASVSGSTSSPLASTHRTFPLPQSISPNFDNERLFDRIACRGQQDVLKAALTAIAKSNEQIDHDLLVKILSNPTILQQLVTLQGTSSGSLSVPSNPMEGSQTVQKSPRASLYRMDHQQPPAAPQVNKAETVSSSSAMISNGPLYPYPNATLLMPNQPSALSVPGVPQVPFLQSVSAASVKDLNYYKNLIHQHGGDRQAEPMAPFTTQPSPIPHPSVNQDSVDNSKSKVMKPCMYFNSSKGCRNGANCSYQHDTSFQQRVTSIPEMQNAKRMKMDREI